MSLKMKNMMFAFIVVCACKGHETKHSESINIVDESSFINMRILDSLTLYMDKENSHSGILPSLLIYYVAFDKKEEESEIDVNIGVSNVAPEVRDSNGQIVGSFNFKGSTVLILDRVPPVASMLYNKNELGTCIESKGEDPPGSGYSGEELTFQW